MLSNSEIESLLDAMRLSQVSTLEVKNKNNRLRLVLPSSSASPSQSVATIPPTQSSHHLEQVGVNSPAIGTFLRRGVDDGLPVIGAGARVITGEVLGYVCHGPVRIIVDAPVNGIFLDDGPDDGAVLGLGDTLFNLEVSR